jgi:hypothetical protein
MSSDMDFETGFSMAPCGFSLTHRGKILILAGFSAASLKRRSPGGMLRVFNAGQKCETAASTMM